MSYDIAAEALRNITETGLPRVSQYTVEKLVRDGLIAATGDADRPYRVVETGEQIGMPL